MLWQLLQLTPHDPRGQSYSAPREIPIFYCEIASARLSGPNTVGEKFQGVCEVENRSRDARFPSRSRILLCKMQKTNMMSKL